MRIIKRKKDLGNSSNSIAVNETNKALPIHTIKSKMIYLIKCTSIIKY